MYYDEDPTTTEQLTVVQINQLKDAWQRANAELVKYKDIAYNLQQKVENLTSVINDSYNQLELETAKSQISQQCCANPNKPVLLIKEVARTLPKMNYHSLVATAFIKTGESWFALTSSSVSQETINFKSRLFDEMLRFRSRARTSKVLVESLPNILPLPVINYIHSGTAPATESVFEVFHDDSKGHGAKPRRGERSAATTENLYHEAIIVRLANPPEDANSETEQEEITLSERIVWMITVAPQHNANPGVDIFTEEIPLRRLAVDHFGAHASFLHSNGDYYSEKASAGDVCAIARDFWHPLLEHTAEVVMTSLLHHFEAKRVQTQLLQSDAVTEFTQLLQHATNAASDFVLEEAGATSYASSTLLETMSQRSEEDGVLQSHTLQDDAYWDKVWQSVPSSLEGFLVQHIEALSTQLPSGDGSIEENNHRVQRTCRCEVYLTSNTLVNEINNAHSMGHHDTDHAAHSHGTGVITELQVINSARQVTSLRVRESGTNDGQTDAVNTVLRVALLKDTSAVQSFSEVSFHERAQVHPAPGAGKNQRSVGGSALGSSRNGVGAGTSHASAEHGPHVEFHTVIAVPLLRTEQQEALGEKLTSAEEAEIGALKGCILVHVTSILIETPQSVGLQDSARNLALARAHPMYASSFTANSTSTHSAYMEHIAGSYNLLEAGRQPLVLAVVDVVDALGGMLLNFLHAHNNRPLNLLSMSLAQSVSGGVGGTSVHDTGSVRGSESVAHSTLVNTSSYADASRWNNCLTDGLFSLLMPSTDAVGSGNGGTAGFSGVASLESLAYYEETKTTHFVPLSHDSLQQRTRAAADPSHAALMYHLCTLFHSDWALVITSEGMHNANTRGTSATVERTARFSPVQGEHEATVRVINNLGASISLSTQQLPSTCRNAIVHSLLHGNTHSSNLKHTDGTSTRPNTTHEFIKEVPGLKNMPVAELLALLEVEPRLKQSIHQMCDSSAAALLHHTVAICLDPRGSVSLGADTQARRKAQAGGKADHAVPAASNMVILTGRFFRGPYHAPLLSTPSVSQLGLLFQTALARRELILVQETMGTLLAERSQAQQEMALTESLEVELAQLQERVFSHSASSVASLVAFRKGLLSVLIDFFAELHKLHFACYTSSVGAGDSGVASALEVIGIEVVVDESTGFDQGRSRKWALSASSADWVRVPDEGLEPATLGSSVPNAARKRVIHAPPVQTLHSHLSTINLAPIAANLTAEVRVDALTGVYEEKGANLLHVCPKTRRPSSRGAEATHSANEDANQIGMSASILVHYEFPVAGPTRSGKNSLHQEAAGAGDGTGKFFSALHSAPSWMRILRSFVGTHSQALFQPLYPVYTPLRLQGHSYQSGAVDEEQQWQDEVLQAQASNLAITALSSTIVQDSSRLLSSPVRGNHPDSRDLLSLANQQHPHYRYLHQRRLLRQLTVMPPFSAFMLLPIRELTTSEISVFDDETSSENSDLSVEVDTEDVRYVHLLPPVVQPISLGHGLQADHRRKSSNPFAQSVLPVKLNHCLRDALHSVRHQRGTGAEHDRTELRTSRLTVLNDGMGSVLHSYLTELNEKQQRRRAHHPGSDEYDLYGYVDVATHGAGEKTSRSVHHEMALVDPHSLVLLYTPLLHSGTKKIDGSNGLADLDETDEGVLSGDVGAELDHYYLIVCRQDRMIVPSSLARLQSCLDELFLPSRVLAASQPWLECMTGIEQLVKAATMGSKVEFKPEETEESNVLAFPSVGFNEPFSAAKQGKMRVPQELGVSFSAPIISVEGQCQRILIETISIMKRVVGERCLGAVGYQLRIGQTDLPDLLAATQESGGVEGYGSASSDMYRAGKEIELVRCCSDSGVVSSRSGKVMSMLQGPSKLQCPATSELIVGRFVHPHARDHRAAVSAAIGALGQGHSPERRHAQNVLREAAAQEQRTVSIHYVEMSSLEHIKQLQHSATSESVLNSSSAAAARAEAEQSGPAAHTRKASNVAAVQELISTAHAFNHADVRVIQLLITSSPTDMPGLHSRREVQIERMPEHVVASVLIYVSMSDNVSEAAGKEEEELPPFTYIHRAEIQQQHVAEVVNTRHPHRRSQASTPSWAAPPASSALSKGILSCIMRVGDTTGALVSSLYRQQYDSYLQAFNTRTRRALMQTHAQRLAHTLLQIQQEISSVVQEEQGNNPGLASASAAKVRHSTPKKNLSNRFDSSVGTHNSFMGEEAGPVGNSTPLLTDADQQKEVAEQAVDALNVLLSQFYALKQQYGHEQQVTVELRNKYKASLDECRTKASQFRSFYDAIKASNAILPLPVRSLDDDDADSLHSGLDKVAAHNAAVPEIVALQTAVASAVCNTQTLRKALEILAELAAHEEFAGYFNSLLMSLSQCSLDDHAASEIQSIGEEKEEAEGFDRLLQVTELTPFAREKLLETAGANEDAPDMFATVWWVLEPGSHINAINLANSVQNVSNSLDVNTLHSKEKFLDALNSKASVLVEGEELLQMLPHLLAFFSSRGHSDGHGNFPTVRLLYQPILVNLPKEEEEALPDDVSYSSRESESITAPAETVVVAVVQYLLSGGSAVALKAHPAGAAGFNHNLGLPDHSSLGGGSVDPSHQGDLSSLAGVLRQVGRDRIEQAIAYMGQHVANLSKIVTLPSGSASVTAHSSRASRYAHHAMHVAMQQHVPRLLLDNNAIGGIHWNALLSALKFIVDPSLLPPSAPANDANSSNSSQSGRSSSAGSVRSARTKRSGSNGSVRSHSVSSSRSVRTSQTKSLNAEKIAAAAVYNPLSVWVGKLLVTLMRAEAASLLHVTGSVKTQLKVRPAVHSGSNASPGGTNPHGIGAPTEPANPTSDRYSNVVYEGVLYKYRHGVVSGGAPNDERSSLNILHVRPSSWTPLQQLIERYQTFFQSSTGSDVYVSYQESVLNYTRKASGGPVYSSRSVATSAASTFAEAPAEGKMCYILAGAINTSSVLPSAAPSAVAGGRKGAHVHFHDTEEESAERVALKENDDFLVVELTRRPSNADIKAFSSVLQLAQAYVWGQQQRNQIKQRDAELGSIANALASSSQKLVEEQLENLQHRQFADLMQELQREQSHVGAERSQVSSAVSVEDTVQVNEGDPMAPHAEDVVRCVKQAQDRLCEVLGGADAAALVSAPRMVCAEVRDLLRSDTVSVASRGSLGIEDELHSARIDTVTRNFSKRALGKIMSVEYAPMGPNGQLDYAQYQNAAEMQYNAARLKFAALAVQLNVVLVCDVADAIVEEAMSLNLHVNKAAVPAIARSIMIPIVDHAPEFAVAAESKSFAAENGLDLSQYDEDQLPTSRLAWIDPALQTSVSNILDTVQGAGNSPDRVLSTGFYQQFHFDLRQRQKQCSYATSSTVANSAHAWALQLVFPTLEARDQYVTKLLGGAGNAATPGVTSALSTPSSSPVSSPVRGETAGGKGSVLPMTFLSGVSQFLKNSFVQCRSAVKDDIHVIQSDFENSVSDRVTECMDQVLLMSSPAETAVPGSASEENETEFFKPEKELPMEFNVDEIAASVAHVFQHFKGKFLSGSVNNNNRDAQEDSASDSEDSVAEPVHGRTTTATFDCTLSGAHLHWSNLPAPMVDKKAPSVRFADTHSFDGEAGATADFKVGAWLTVALNPPAEKKKSDAPTEEKESEVKLNAATKPAASSQSAAKSKPTSKGGLKAEVPPVEEEETPSKGCKKARDEVLYKCCKLKQWQTQRSSLSAAQIQAVQDSSQGMMLYVMAAPKSPPRKEPRPRSQSPNAHFSMHGGAAGYSSTAQGSRTRPGSVFSSANANAFTTENDASVGVGEYLNADGCVHLQMLLLITGSEQPAILELRVKCFVTSGDSSPAALTKYTGRQRPKRNPETVLDELALAEMMEQVACMVLQPTLPVFRLVRSSVAHLLEHCVAARGLVMWEAEWEHFLQHAQQRISLLSSCLTLLTSEGHKATGLLQQVQEALCRLPSLTASTLLCRDTTTNQIIYNRTLDYANNHVSDELNSTATPQSSMGFMSPAPRASQGNNANFSDNTFGPTTPRGEHKVSYMDLSRDPRHRLPEDKMDHTMGATSLKDQFGNVEMVNPSLDQLEQLELVFECYEVQGSLTVYFAPGEAANFATDLRNSAEFQSDGLFCPGPASTARSPSASRRAPVSPYEPLRSPSAHRRAREAQRRLQIRTDPLGLLSPTTQDRSSANRSNMLLLEDLEDLEETPRSGRESHYSEKTAQDSKRRDLVSLHTLLETITRAMARRVFELHRGSKNKKMMASKQHELSKRTSQLQQEAEKVSTLEAMNNMSRQELQTAASESERLRLLMYAEQRNLKEALKQKKEMNAHLRQSLLEQRQESDTRALVHKKQQQELREKISALEQAKQKELKELDRVRSKGINAENSISTLTYQLAEVQRQQKTAEATVRQLRTDLALAQKELGAAQSRDKVRTEGDDSKTKGFLVKISRLDEELAAAKGTNAFLKKQLEATSLSLKIAQEENNRNAPHFSTSTGRTATHTASHTVNISQSHQFASTTTGNGNANNLHSSSLSGAAVHVNTAHSINAAEGGDYSRARTPPPGARLQAGGGVSADGASPLYEDMSQSLQREQQNTARLRKQLQDMNLDRQEQGFH